MAMGVYNGGMLIDPTAPVIPKPEL